VATRKAKEEIGGTQLYPAKQMAKEAGKYRRVDEGQI